MTRLSTLLSFLCLFAVSACHRAKEEPLPTLGKLPAFELTDQAGRAVSPATMRGRPWLAAFLFTRCPSVCPKITARMLEIERATKEAHPELGFVGISVDPEFDTPQVLDAYAERQKVDRKRWSFWTGAHQTIADVAEKGFRIGLSGKATEGAEHLGITHGSHLILIDGRGDIRGYFGSFDDDLLPRLQDALDRLGTP